jgi:hypothetical protein
LQQRGQIVKENSRFRIIGDLSNEFFQMVHSASSAFPNELPILYGSRWLKSLCGNFQIFVGHGFTGCGKT